MRKNVAHYQISNHNDYWIVKKIVLRNDWSNFDNQTTLSIETKISYYCIILPLKNLENMSFCKRIARKWVEKSIKEIEEA